MRDLMVFTSKSVDEILETGGTGHWNLTPARVAGMEFAVCTYCDTPDPTKKRNVVSGLSRGAAFMVGRISGLRQSKTENGRQRYVVEFSEYAILDQPKVWDGSRNPVRYVEREYLAQSGVNFGELEFKPMPISSDGRTDQPAAADHDDEALTIDQAKAGLAKQFGVPVEQIQIVISA